jgi:hypothetical protein
MLNINNLEAFFDPDIFKPIWAHKSYLDPPNPTRIPKKEESKDKSEEKIKGIKENIESIGKEISTLSEVKVDISSGIQIYNKFVNQYNQVIDNYNYLCDFCHNHPITSPVKNQIIKLKENLKYKNIVFSFEKNSISNKKIVAILNIMTKHILIMNNIVKSIHDSLMPIDEL